MMRTLSTAVLDNILDVATWLFYFRLFLFSDQLDLYLHSYFYCFYNEYKYI